MFHKTFSTWMTFAWALVALGTFHGSTTRAQEQFPVPTAAPAQSVRFQVSGDTQRLEMVVNTSRILTVDYNVPKVLVHNTDIVQATPISPNQIHISALAAGMTAINLWDENDNIRVIDLRVVGDVRELEEQIKRRFPTANVDVEALNTSVLLGGYVPRPDMVARVVEIAEEYFPKVVNHLQVGGTQQVLLKVQVMEVSRTKLRRLGIDWAILNGNDFVIQSVSGLIAAAATQGGGLTGAGADTVRFGVIDNQSTFGAFIDTLRQNNLAKVLAEPTLVTVSGRSASFNSGGEIPVPISAGLGVTSVEYREFGTTVDFVPIVLGNGMIKLEVRPQITEIDPSLRDPVTGTPGFRSRRVDTAVELRAGQTMALAGLIQSRVDAENIGLPWIADVPFFGLPFRRVQETQNEVELLVMVTPELVAPLEAHEVPQCGPGRSTTSPSDIDLYGRGYLEVPTCCSDGSCQDCAGQVMPGRPVGPSGPAPIYQEELPMQPTQQGGPIEDARATQSGRVRAPIAHQQTSAPGRQHSRGLLVNGFKSYRPVRQTSATNPQNHYTPNNGSQSINQQRSPAPQSGNFSESAPALIGPIGYDVLD